MNTLDEPSCCASVILELTLKRSTSLLWILKHRIHEVRLKLLLKSSENNLLKKLEVAVKFLVHTTVPKEFLVLETN